MVVADLPTTLVIDASVGLKWALDEADALATACPMITANRRFAAVVLAHPYLAGKVILLGERAEERS